MLQVNWKAAATMMTGATALAGWLAAPPAVPRQAAAGARDRSARSAPSSSAAPAPLALDIPSVSYRPPRRNPFLFGATPDTAVPPAARRAQQAPAIEPATPAADPVPFRLSGIAADTADGAIRTAVLAGGPTGLVLARQGDVVAGFYRVERVEAEAVDLVDTRDGRVHRLGLGAADSGVR